MKAILILITSFVFHFACISQSIIFPFGSNWKYLDNGSNQGTTWRTLIFNDGAWKTGNAELGYGDGDEATTISYGSSAKKKYITTYFRKSISIVDPSQYASFKLSLKRDDGALVYINGTEVFRSNMPTSSISYSTKALSEILDDGLTLQTIELPTSFFVNGTNMIAVEIHQFSGTGPDLSFDLQLITNPKINQVPIANAGADKTITLPVSSITLSGSGTDLDGTITNYAWTWVSGPATGSITSPSAASTSVTGLTTAGTYVYKLTVTDNNGAKASDNVNVIVNPSISALTLIPWSSTWKFLDNGSDLGTFWKESSFDDTIWPSGAAELGYGDNPITVLNSNYTTYYFRKQISFNNPSDFAGVSLNVRRDDGIAVYLNGFEIYRSNLAPGVITYSTLATGASDDGDAIESIILPISIFIAGVNTIAAEVHQSSLTSSDLTFDLELVAKTGNNPTLIRGPYLQMGNQNSVILKWRTDFPTDSKIEVGTVYGSYNLSVTDPVSTTDHEVKITGLNADSKYFYRFGSSTSILEGSVSNYFTTAPPENTTRKIRVAAFGDCGTTNNGTQASTIASYQNHVGANPAELMLLLGDNAYNWGTEDDYQNGFFRAYSSNILKNHILFPTPGNHDYAGTLARQIDKKIAYYDIFKTPQIAECGGVASYNKSYYSFDWGNIHFISLDSYGMETSSNYRLYDTLSPQVTWLKTDLAANTKKWTVAFWHHPPFTMGSHNSDLESELKKIRERFIRIMERYGVDMILCGHSHDYERSYLLKGYYTDEPSFNVDTHAVNSSSGKYDGSLNSCAYQTKSTLKNHGTVYVVSGSAGRSDGVQTEFPHNAMPFSYVDAGMFYFEIEDNRLDAKFIRKDGVIADQFSIMKDVAKTTTLTINAGQSIELTASWKGTYNWSNGAKTRTILVSPSVSTTYTCTDAVGCITDQFTVSVTPSTQTSARLSLEMSQDSNNPMEFNAYPIPVKRGEYLHIENSNKEISELTITNSTGKVFTKLNFQGTYDLNTVDLPSGFYLFLNKSGLKSTIKKVIILD